MEKITLRFYARCCLNIGSRITVILTLDEHGKQYSIEREFINPFETNTVEPVLPQRVMKAFTESAINNILAKDEISFDQSIHVLDGYDYEVTITKGDVTKKYQANDNSIETYPLLRYLASWCRK